MESVWSLRWLVKQNIRKWGGECVFFLSFFSVYVFLVFGNVAK